MTAERVKALEIQQVNDSKKLDMLIEKTDSNEARLKNIEIALGNQRGWIAGAASVIVFVWGIVAAVAVSIWDSIVGTIWP